MLKRSNLIMRLFRRDTRGTAAVEFAVAAMFLCAGVLSAVDLGLYEYKRMEVENAAQVGAQAVWKTCYDTSAMLPAIASITSVNDVRAIDSL